MATALTYTICRIGLWRGGPVQANVVYNPCARPSATHVNIIGERVCVHAFFDDDNDDALVDGASRRRPIFCIEGVSVVLMHIDRQGKSRIMCAIDRVL